MASSATEPPRVPEERRAIQGASRTITETDIVAFSAITRDWHPQHSNAVWAATSTFGERVAHGMLVLSYAIGLLPLHLERVIALRRIADAVFKRPVRIGDTVTSYAEVRSTRPLGDRQRLVEWQVTVTNQYGKTVAKGTLVAVCEGAASPVPADAPTGPAHERFARPPTPPSDEPLSLCEDARGAWRVLL